EEIVGDIRADVGDARLRIILRLGKETSVGDVQIINVGHVRSRAVNRHVFKNLRAAFDLRARRIGTRAESVNQLRALAQIIKLGERQIFISSLRGGNRVEVLEIIEAEAANAERLRADACDLLIEI